MQTEELLKTFTDLVTIDSPSFEEAGVAAYCEEALRNLGFTVCFDNSGKQTGSNTGNLLASLPGNAHGVVVLAAHMDSVEPCCGIQPVIENGVITSAGDTVLGSDDKAGIAAILQGVKENLFMDRPRPSIVVVLTTAEEKNCQGAKYLDEALLRDVIKSCVAQSADPDCLDGGPVPCVVFDSDGAPGTIVTGAPYHYSFVARVAGKEAHAGVNPEQGVSALEIAAKALASLEWGRLSEFSTANIGMIHGGQAINVVANDCTVEGECRSVYEDRVKAQQIAITEAFETQAKALGGSVQVDWEIDYPGVFYQTDDPFLQLLKDAADAKGFPVTYLVSGGGSDANVFSTKGLKPVTVGVGMTNFHSVDEYITVEDLENAARYVKAILLTMAAQ